MPKSAPSSRIASTPKEIAPYFQSFSRKNKTPATATRTTGVANISSTPARSISAGMGPWTKISNQQTSQHDEETTEGAHAQDHRNHAIEGWFAELAHAAPPLSK